MTKNIFQGVVKMCKNKNSLTLITTYSFLPWFWLRQPRALPAFIGVFDGKGHTVTTTTARFVHFEGTAKDLKIAGEIPEIKIGEAVLYNAGFAMFTAGKAHFENITNILGDTTGSILGYAKIGFQLK